MYRHFHAADNGHTYLMNKVPYLKMTHVDIFMRANSGVVYHAVF